MLRTVLAHSQFRDRTYYKCWNSTVCTVLEYNQDRQKRADGEKVVFYFVYRAHSWRNRWQLRMCKRKSTGKKSLESRITKTACTEASEPFFRAKQMTHDQNSSMRVRRPSPESPQRHPAIELSMYGFLPSQCCFYLTFSFTFHNNFVNKSFNIRFQSPAACNNRHDFITLQVSIPCCVPLLVFFLCGSLHTKFATILDLYN